MWIHTIYHFAKLLKKIKLKEEIFFFYSCPDSFWLVISSFSDVNFSDVRAICGCKIQYQNSYNPFF